MQIYTLDMQEMTKLVKLTAPGLLYYYKHYVGWLNRVVTTLSETIL